MHATQNPVSPATTPTVADTLRRAALYLIRHGWTQDHTYNPPATAEVFPATDVLGALVLAVTGRTLLPVDLLREGDTATVREFNDAAVYLARWLGLLANTAPALDTDYWPALAAQNLLWKWNDSPWQDQAHVVDGLLCAAADADGTVYDPDLHRPYAADFAALGLTTGRPTVTTPNPTGPCWSDFCIASLCNGVHHVDATGYTWTETSNGQPATVPAQNAASGTGSAGGR